VDAVYLLAEHRVTTARWYVVYDSGKGKMKRSWFGLLGLFGLLSVHDDNHETDLMPEIVCPACLRKIEECRCLSLPSPNDSSTHKRTT
jgi:hypothetical protein